MMQSPRLGSVVAAVAIALAGTTLTPVVAHAKPIKEETIKKECKKAGGTYSTTSGGGGRHSACSFKDINGNAHLDEHIDGEYVEPPA